MEQILKDVRILDLTHGLAGGFCTMNLGDYGAEVIKVELPDGDPLRQRGPFLKGQSTLFNGVGRNKKSICIDYTTHAGKFLLLRLAQSCDILVESQGPGVLDALGLDYQTVSTLNPGIIYASLSGYGHTGPLKDQDPDDLLVTAMSGMMDRTGLRGEGPMMPGVDFGCTYAGVTLLNAISLALFQKLTTGMGNKIEVSMLDCIFYMLELFVMDRSITGHVTPKNGNHDTEVAPLGTFATKDGYIAIAISSEGQWKKFCALLEMEALAEDPRFVDNAARVKNLDALIPILEGHTAQYAKDDLATLMGENKLAAGSVKTVAELVNEPQAIACDLVFEVEDPELGKQIVLGNAMHFSKTRTVPLAAKAATLGEHTQELLSSLDLTPAIIEGLEKDGIVRCH